jgi:hypothetical protein
MTGPTSNPFGPYGLPGYRDDESRLARELTKMGRQFGFTSMTGSPN